MSSKSSASTTSLKSTENLEQFVALMDAEICLIAEIAKLLRAQSAKKRKTLASLRSLEQDAYNHLLVMHNTMFTPCPDDPSAQLCTSLRYIIGGYRRGGRSVLHNPNGLLFAIKRECAEHSFLKRMKKEGQDV